MKSICFFLALFFISIDIEAQNYLNQERYEELLCDSLAITQSIGLECSNSKESSYIGKVIISGLGLILSEYEIETFFNVTQVTSDSILLKSPQKITIVYKDNYRTHHVSKLIKQRSDNFIGDTLLGLYTFKAMYEDVSLYKLSGIDLTDAVGVVLMPLKKIKIRNFRVQKEVIDADTINSSGEQIRRICLSLSKHKRTDIYFIVREPYAKIIDDRLFTPEDKSAFVVINPKCYQTSMYWKGQGDIFGY